MRATFLCLIGLMMVGCSSKPVVKTEIVYVDRAVMISCVKEIPQKPEFQLDNLKRPQNPYTKLKALKIERLQLKAYSNELEATLEGCK